jgi:hypothetical protein
MLEEARVLAERALMVHNRHDVLQVIMGRASPEVRKRLRDESLVRQDQFLEALYGGAKFAALDEEAKLLVSPAEGVPPPALAAPPLSHFMYPPVYDEDQLVRDEFEWLWDDTFMKVVLHREPGTENMAVRVEIRQHTIRGFERVAMGVVFAPLARWEDERGGMWARLHVLRAPSWRPGEAERQTGREAFRRVVYLWCVLMAGYEVEVTDLELQGQMVAEDELERIAAEGFIELLGSPGPGRQMVCVKQVLEALR